jgi:BirA family biotin operon repressor/biotin-[acetyl-CoA-carboxylase] ligase
MDQLSVPALKDALATQVVGRRIVHLPVASSTNEVAKTLARRRAREGTVVIAEEQTAGKGRLGRGWTAPAGTSLLLSVILRPTRAQLPQLIMLSSLAACRAVEGVTGLAARLKWPNDILVNGRKLGGILTEVDLLGNRPRFAVVGIGLNVNFDVGAVPEIRESATSVSLELGRDFPRQELLLALLRELDDLYLALRRGQSLREEWRGRLETLGRWIRVTGRGGVEEGWAEDVDEGGRLLLRRADGSLVALSEGEVSLR